MTTRTLIASALISFIGFSSNISHAFLPEDPNFSPVACGSTQMQREIGTPSPIQQVCLGQTNPSLEQAAKDAVEFRMVNGLRKVFHVTGTKMAPSFPNGTSVAIVYLRSDDGSETTLRVLKNSEGMVEAAQGHAGGVAYVIPSFTRDLPLF